MLRFIDIRGQGTGYRFAFWNTVTDNFLNIGGSVVWSSRLELEVDCDHDTELYNRCSSLCPDWVDDGKEDDVDAFYGEGEKS